MEAKEREFSFIQEKMELEIPFFQRGYVWTEENWEELIEDLLDSHQSHFIGSIILKIQTKTDTGSVDRAMVIDGQQRLTTLSILARACFDSLPFDSHSEEWHWEQKSQLNNTLMYKESQKDEDWKTKISHSRLDSEDYNSVIRGEWTENYFDIILDSEAKQKENPSTKILQCYKYFMSQLKGRPTEDTEKLWDILTGNQVKMLVKIDLATHENEQAIFDTVNSAGVRLTSSDTIKNALFQRAIEQTADNPTEKAKVIDFYSKTWESAFLAEAEQLDYWQKERSLGRIVRDNQEILLHCVALIKGFYDPDKHKISDLSMLYKEFIESFSTKEIFSFIKEICDYANTYRQHFEDFDNTTLLSYSNDEQRLFHILERSDISTLHPYILKLLRENELEKGDELPDDISTEFRLIENYVLRHLVCGVTTKNFNKDCLSLVRGEKTLSDLFFDKPDELSDAMIKAKLRVMPNNKLPTLLLFWIELKKRFGDKHDLKELKYSYSLEHIMPQKWSQHWSVESLPAINTDTNEVIADPETARQIRSAVIYEIGNMTLLNSRLNASLRNYQFQRKVDGEGRKKGMREYADLSVAKEVIDKSHWDESAIRERTDSIAREFLEIWKFPS